MTIPLVRSAPYQPSMSLPRLFLTKSVRALIMHPPSIITIIRLARSEDTISLSLCFQTANKDHHPRRVLRVFLIMERVASSSMTLKRPYRFQETGILNQPPTLLRTAVVDLMAQYEPGGNQIETVNSALAEKLRLRYISDSKHYWLHRSQVVHP